MERSWLHWPALGIAAVGAMVVPVAAFSSVVRRAIVGPLTLVEVAVVILLFLRMLFDVRVRRGIDATNLELQGGQLFRFRRRRVFDPEWGLFGSRTGDLPLQIVRAVLFAEFIATVALAGVLGVDTMYLATSGFAVATALTLLCAGMAGAEDRTATST